MRVIHTLVLLIFLTAVIVFCVQNHETITVDYFKWKIEAPFPALVFIIYLVGMISGWAVLSYLRRSVRRITEHQS